MARAGLAAIARGSGANVVPRTREESAERCGAERGGAGVGGLGTVLAPQAEEGAAVWPRGNEVSRIKRRKQGVSGKLGRPCAFSLWIVMFRAL